MEAVYESAHNLMNIAKAIKELVNEVNVSVSQDGFEIQSIDSSHVCLVHLVLTPSSFLKWSCTKKLTLGIKMDMLINTLTKEHDQVILRANDEEVLFIEIVNKDNTKRESYELSLMSITCDALEIKDIPATSEIIFGTDVYSKTCQKMITFSDTLNVHVQQNPKRVIFSCSSENIRNAKTELEPTPSIMINCTKETILSFSLRHLHSFAKAGNLSTNGMVMLRMTEDLPLVVRYQLHKDPNAHLSYYLAPKVKDN